MPVRNVVNERGDELKAAVSRSLPALAASMEWSVAESGRGALLFANDRIFAEIIVDDTDRDGFGLFLEDKSTGSEVDVWLDTAEEVVTWICGHLKRPLEPVDIHLILL